MLKESVTKMIWMIFILNMKMENISLKANDF